MAFGRRFVRALGAGIGSRAVVAQGGDALRRLFALPRSPRDLSTDEMSRLVAPLFGRTTSLAVAHGAPIALCLYIALHSEQVWCFAFLAADVILLALRLAVLLSVKRQPDLPPAALLRAARRYFAVGIAWAISTGMFCACCYALLTDEALRMMAVTLVMGTASGAACRNASTPRFAVAQVSALMLPQVAACLAHGPLYWLQAAQVIIYLVALCSIIRRQYADVCQIMEAQREKDALVRQSEHQARHDALTGLPNRVLFRERLDAALVRARHGQPFAVLCLDLDRFKDVNDTLGHAAGDALLRAVAARLQGALRAGDTLARLGGDEFALIQASAEQPGDAGGLARRIVDLIAAPFDLRGDQAAVGTSIGIAIAPRDGMDAETLLKHADMALYCAKAEGRGRWCFFEAAMDARLQLRRALELDMRRAIAAGEFVLHYQPVVEIATRRVAAMEALLRWQHPERGLVPPDAFIPLAEEVGLIVPMGEWALSRATADAAGWPLPVKVAVNLSPAQFASRRLVEAVRDALADAALDPGRLELEITETAMLQDTDAVLAMLHPLKALGVRIAMDDFGTGYSSLGHLQRFPFDKVKIDRSFIRGVEHSPQSDAIIRSVIGLCDRLAMTTTAEGVETEGQFLALRQRGCIEAQGFLFSEPVPAAQVPALLERLSAPVDA